MRELRAHVHGQDEGGAAEGAEVALQVRLLLHRLRGGLAHHEGHEGQGKLSYHILSYLVLHSVCFVCDNMKTCYHCNFYTMTDADKQTTYNMPEC